MTDFLAEFLLEINKSKSYFTQTQLENVSEKSNLGVQDAFKIVETLCGSEFNCSDAKTLKLKFKNIDLQKLHSIIFSGFLKKFYSNETQTTFSQNQDLNLVFCNYLESLNKCHVLQSKKYDGKLERNELASIVGINGKYMFFLQYIN